MKNQTVQIKKKHLITGISIISIIKVALIVAIIYLSLTLISMKQELKSDISNLQNELQNKISENQAQTQEQIRELSDSLIVTKSDFNSQINELKAESSSDFSGIIQKVIPGVVSVGTDVSQGSGFIISQDGYIITNAHVLSGGHYIRVLIYNSDSWKPAELVGYNENIDVAILKISGTNYDFLEFGKSSDVEIGQKVIAIGNPLGLSFSVTEGIISAKERKGSNELPIYFQIDVPLNRGNSGGPLIDKKGKVIGINNFKIANSESLNFALESDYAVSAINEILQANNKTIII